jgi:hypothetical protein
MTVSLMEYSKTFPIGSMERPFIETFVAESDIMAACPVKKVTGGKHTFFRTARLPTVQFRGINQAGNISAGNISKFEENVTFMDEFVRVDRAMIDNFGGDHRAQQEKMKAMAMAQLWTQTLIKGDNLTTSGIEPDGLQRRCSALNTTLFPNSLSAGGAPLSLANLDQAINACRRRTHIIAPYSIKFRFDAAARNTAVTGFNTIQDENNIGKSVLTFKGTPILWGYEPDDSVLPIDFNEVGFGGGGAVTSSIYIVNFAEDGLTGIEGVPLTVKDEGILPGTPTYSTSIKWDFGYAIEHPRAAVRLSSITNAAFLV